MKILHTLLLAAAVAASPAAATEKLKPFVLAATQPGEPQAAAAAAAKSLSQAGFEVVGRYSPYPSAVVLVATSDALRQAAAGSKFGGYGAAIRVAATRVGDAVQVSYTDPRYLAAAYRLNADLGGVAGQLRAALGSGTAFGAKDGMTDEELRSYRYMFGMERFSDPLELAAYPSQAEALAAVEKGLAEARSGVTKVYRIDLPGKAESVFGVAMDGSKGDGEQQDDGYIMRQIDFQPSRSTAHLPYEMLVSDGKVYALSARFRIAINFPDLSMMGSNSFMSIMASPDAIRRALMLAAGGKPDADPLGR